MSDYGLLQAVIVDPKGTALSTAAAISDTELVVDNAQDFDHEGGILDLNGARLAYTSITEGASPDDSDTIALAAALLVGADENDTVSPVVGNLIPEDWYAVVTMGDEGDEVHVPLSVDQRSQWPVGEYPDPVPVMVSDDMRHLLDAPGRTVSSRNAFRNTDSYAYDGVAASIVLPLSQVPISGSEQPFWKADTVAVGGAALPPGSWRIELPNLIIDDSGLMAEFSTDDLFWVDYAYDAATADINRPAQPPPLAVGNSGNLSSPDGTLQNFDSLNIVAGIDGQDVTASRAGTITEVHIATGAEVSASIGRIVTGSLSGMTFTVTDVSAQFTIPGSTPDPAVVAVSVMVNAGDLIGLYQPSAGAVTNIGYDSATNANNKLGYRASVGGVPSSGDVITLTAVSANLGMFLFGTDA